MQDAANSLIVTDHTEHIQSMFAECLKRYAVDSSTQEPRDAEDVVRMALRTLRKNGYSQHQIAAALNGNSVISLR